MTIKFGSVVYKIKNINSIERFLLIHIKVRVCEHICRVECLNEKQALDYYKQIVSGKCVDLTGLRLTNAWA